MSRTKQEAFVWHKPEIPLVTNCCLSLAWAETFPTAEGLRRGVKGGTYCYQCKEVKPNNVHRITLEEYRQIFRPDTTEEEFNNLYDHD